MPATPAPCVAPVLAGGRTGANAAAGVGGPMRDGFVGFAAGMRPDEAGGLKGWGWVGAATCGCVIALAGGAGNRPALGGGGFGARCGSGSGATRVDSPGPGTWATPEEG